MCNLHLDGRTGYCGNTLYTVVYPLTHGYVHFVCLM